MNCPSLQISVDLSSDLTAIRDFCAMCHRDVAQTISPLSLSLLSLLFPHQALPLQDRYRHHPSLLHSDSGLHYGNQLSVLASHQAVAEEYPFPLRLQVQEVLQILLMEVRWRWRFLPSVQHKPDSYVQFFDICAITTVSIHHNFIFLCLPSFVSCFTCLLLVLTLCFGLLGCLMHHVPCFHVPVTVPSLRREYRQEYFHFYGCFPFSLDLHLQFSIRFDNCKPPCFCPMFCVLF